VTTPLDFHEIPARNLRIDRDQMEKAQEVINYLRERGMRRKGYDLAPRTTGLRPSAKRPARPDPRLVRLRRSQDDE